MNFHDFKKIILTLNFSILIFSSKISMPLFTNFLPLNISILLMICFFPSPHQQMFVRMFVDENLDRMIPISKQPKEKVQAIIDSCARQFPDFSERARKRLRTYLKSCRRNKKTKDGWENQPSRPTPAHLTSVQAEQILSIACENESLNAKRMRIGLEPISQSLNIPSSHSSEAQSTQSLYTTAKSSMDSLTTPLSISTSIANCKTSPIISTTTDSNANSIK